MPVDARDDVEPIPGDTLTSFRVAPGRWFATVSRLLLQAFIHKRRSTVPYEWFSDTEVGSLDAAAKIDDPARVDDNTWRDLEVPELLERLGGRASILGRQHLYRRLRRGGAVAHQVRAALAPEKNAESSRLLEQTQAVRNELRCQDHDTVPALFFDALPRVPGFARHMWIAPVALTMCLVAAAQFGSWLLAVSGAIVYLITFGITQIKLAEAASTFKTQRLAIMETLAAARGLAIIGRRHPHPLLEAAVGLQPVTERLQSALSLNLLESIPQLLDTVNLLTLYDCLTLDGKVAGLRGHLDLLRKVHEMVAQCEASLCLIEVLRPQAEAMCWARDGGAGVLRLMGMYNPLLDGAEKLTIELDTRGAFVTGENGVGKSTFLRAIGLNVLVARAFGYCHADEAIVPRLPVWSSIRNEDCLARSESLYMAELRRAETLLKVSRQATGAIFLIDEVFRGTNNLESVAAAASVIHHLAGTSLVIVSSHNLVLAPLLGTRLNPMRIVRRTALKLEPGVLAETNGIRMMDGYQFDASIRADAKRIFDWYSSYVTMPANFPDLQSLDESSDRAQESDEGRRR
jgi:hypothetical protein